MTQRLRADPRLGAAALIVTNGPGPGPYAVLGLRAKSPNRGRWVVPGGKVRPGERIRDAAAREALEETGHDIAVQRLLGVYEIITPDIDEHRVIVCHLATIVGGAPVPSGDMSDLMLVPLRDLPAIDITPVCLSMLADAATQLSP